MKCQSWRVANERTPLARFGCAWRPGTLARGANYRLETIDNGRLVSDQGLPGRPPECLHAYRGAAGERKIPGARRSCGQPFRVVTEGRIPATEGLFELPVEIFCSRLEQQTSS